MTPARNATDGGHADNGQSARRRLRWQEKSADFATGDDRRVDIEIRLPGIYGRDESGFCASGGAAIGGDVRGVPATGLGEVQDVVIGTAGDAKRKASKSGRGGRDTGR